MTTNDDQSDHSSLPVLFVCRVSNIYRVIYTLLKADTPMQHAYLGVGVDIEEVWWLDVD